MLCSWLIRYLLVGLTFVLHANNDLITNLRFYPIQDIARASLMHEIEQKLHENGYVFLIGFGGMGKSRLARHFGTTSQSKSTYQIIWWIDGKKNLFGQLRDLINEINKYHKNSSLSDFAVNEEILMDKLENFAKKHALKILIIFDSLEDVQKSKSMLESNQRKNMHIVITTRKDHGYASFIKIPPFTKEESLAYLKKVLPIYDTQDCQKLALTLHNYPLALSQSSHFLQQHPTMSIDEYVTLYQSNIQSIWDREEQCLSQVEEQAHSVRITVKLALQEIAKISQLPKQILILFSLLNNQFIPETLIYEICESLSWSKTEIQDALSLLVNYNFINPNKTEKSLIFYNIHEIVQESVLIESEPKTIDAISQKILEKFLHLMQFNKNRIISFAKENHFLIAHIIKFLANVKANKKLYSDYLKINVFLLDYFLYVKRDHAKALSLIDIIYPNLELIDDPVIKARFLSSAGDVTALHKLGEKIEKDIFVQMEATLKSGKILDKYEIVRLQNSIGQNLLLRAFATQAKEYIYASLPLIKEFKDAETKIPTFYFLAWVAIELGNYEDALSFLNESIALFCDAPDTPIKFYTYNFKALSLLNLKKHQAALDFSETSINKCRDYFGLYVSDTLAEALTYKAKAILHIDGSPTKSLPIIKEAADAYNIFYKGSDMVLDQANTYMVYGDCFLLQENFTLASPQYVKSLMVIDKLSASKTSKLFHDLIVRLIYVSQKLKNKNLQERYLRIYKNNFTDQNTTKPRILYKRLPKEIIQDF